MKVNIFDPFALVNSAARHAFDIMPSRGGTHSSRYGCDADAGHGNYGFR